MGLGIPFTPNYACPHRPTSLTVMNDGNSQMHPVDLIVIVIVLILYFAPSITAAERKHPQTAAIFCLNFFLGWTLIGWVGALVWSLVTTEAHRQRLERLQ